ncbi:MAG TPA: SagB/ThcOx family dehydrogenase [Levilinea sp.]|nr:SagB/ThcOx family dehydrogenase [Levilinea sp.]
MVLFVFLVLACAPVELQEVSEPSPQAEAEILVEDLITLPDPVLVGTMTIEETMAKRRSVRSYSEELLTVEEIGQLLWSAQGITHPAGLRTAPSAGALYPLEVYAITQEGVYHYDPHQHTLSLHLEGDLRPALHVAALGQDSVLEGPLVVAITVVYERTEVRYGMERTPRYVYLEVGHAAQNLLLQAVALELGAVVIGAFFDNQVKSILSLPANEHPIYLIPVGHPR